MPHPHLEDHAHIRPPLSTLEAQLERYGEGGEERTLVESQPPDPNCWIQWKGALSLQKPLYLPQLLEEDSLWKVR